MESFESLCVDSNSENVKKEVIKSHRVSFKFKVPELKTKKNVVPLEAGS